MSPSTPTNTTTAAAAANNTTPTKPNHPETISILLAALMKTHGNGASHDLSINYKHMAALSHGARSEYAWQHEFRAIKARAKELLKEMDEAEGDAEGGKAVGKGKRKAYVDDEEVGEEKPKRNLKAARKVGGKSGKKKGEEGEVVV